MLGSHIHNTYAPSTPTNPFVAAPCRPKGIGLTGNISTAYDTGVVSDADGPIIAKLHPHTTQPARCARSIAVQVASAVAQNVKSFVGQVDVHANHQNGAYGRKPVVLPTSDVQNNQSHGSSHYIPKNSISPANDNSQPIRGHYPSVPNIPPAITNGLFPLPPILLPAPASPISPLLAAPPQAHYSPLPSPSSSHPSLHRHLPSSSPSTPRHILPHARASSTSESIKGFDLLGEKKAFFREGEEELITPFYQRSRNKPSPLSNGVGASEADFWKRFSVSVRLDEIDRQKGSSR
ncbi:hypothetical protein I314_06556 [Cryptococcus bacillisporus CA1873]|uniref:Uncharacterized protein n=1 Tax=Cryptococcus bacillisporus CA1873 TaxID=1296111 RepID=A0ABR5B271_CRYGA|nr:hypothetical protein I314_06556 [Cryptococcus bacillisporus CA1873]|eukprot:KIR57661.1 hypothetical protein I314_06556 [Cryptococcus gattii CA1873]